MKALKNMGFGPRKSKSGFTLIELLIVMVILAILAGVVVMAVGGVFGTSKNRAYDVTKDELKNAVADYSTRFSGAFPYNASLAGWNTSITLTTGGTVTGYIINVSALLVTNGGLLSKAPASVANISGTNDNCDWGTANYCGASQANSHYIWYQDTYGNIYSLCSNANGGTACNATTYDGFQTTYP